MKILIAAAITLIASAAFAHDAPPKSQPATAPKAATQPVTKPVKGHSGGTDAAGCHTNSQTGDYHCHRPK